MGKEYVFMRWFFMQRGHTLLFMHIQTDRIDLLWEMELSLHYQELSLKIKFWLISLANRVLTWFLSFQQEVWILGYRQRTYVTSGNGQWWNDPNMIIPCYFLKSVPQTPQTHSSLSLWIYDSQKCSRVFSDHRPAHRKCGREWISKMCTQGSAKVHSLRPSRYLLGVHGRGCSFL